MDGQFKFYIKKKKVKSLLSNRILCETKIVVRKLFLSNEASWWFRVPDTKWQSCLARLTIEENEYYEGKKRLNTSVTELLGKLAWVSC